MNAWRIDDAADGEGLVPVPAASPALAALRRADIGSQNPPRSPTRDAAAVDATGADARVTASRAAADGPAVVGRLERWPSRRSLWVAASAAIGGSLLAAATIRPSGRAVPGTVVVPSVAARGQQPAEALLPSWLSSAAEANKQTVPSLPGAEQLLQRGAAGAGTPEGRLLRVYGLMASGHGVQALDEARRLAQDVPNFALANLVYADLLKSRAEPLAGFGAVPSALAAAAASAASSTAGRGIQTAAPSTGSPAAQAAPGATTSPSDLSERLKDLSAEARARVGTAALAPPPGTVPSQFLFVGPSVRHAIAIDTSRSRLYLFENTANGLVLKRDYYASVGKLGTAKRIEGDMRTPLGVYFVTGRLSRARLADRYGASAMVLNYPNQYDLIRGRTGSGIWLHGVESTSFSRAPLATDGCVALSNPDLLALTNDVDRQSTPVVIADRLEWVPAGQTAQVPPAFAQAFDVWRGTRQQADPAAELALYANAHADAYASLFRPLSAGGGTPPQPRGVTTSTAAMVQEAAGSPDGSGTALGAIAITATAPASVARGTTPANWIDVLRAERSRPGSAAVQLTRLSVLAWHDREDVMLVTYTETTSRDTTPRLKRQYWLRRDGAWSIVFDGAVG